MVNLEKGELVELNECELGIALLNKVLYIFHEDYKPVEIKTKCTTNGDLEKQISKAIPALMKILGLETACEVVAKIMNMVFKRELGHSYEDFNLRLTHNWQNNEYTLRGWY